MKEISVNAIIKDLESGTLLFAAVLRQRKENKQSEVNTKELNSLIHSCKDVFPEEPPKRLPPELIKGDFCIELKNGSTPVKKGLYRMSHTELEEVKTQVEKLLEQGFIRLSISPWRSPVLFASKKEGRLRFASIFEH